MDDWIELAALAMAAGAAAFTLTRTKVTDPMRRWLVKKSSWLGALFSCPYCLGHWLALVAALIYQPQVTDSLWLLDFGVAWLVMVFLTALVTGLIGRSIKASLP